MKKYIPFLLLGIVLYCSSCCDKEACVQVTGIPISFSGFKSRDLDTVYTIGYERVSGFTNILRDTVADTIQRGYNASDSVWVLKTRDGGAGGAGGLTHNMLSGDYNWEIWIPGANKIVRLSRYTYLSYTCHSCDEPEKPVQSLATVGIGSAQVSVDAVVIYY